MNGNQYTGLRQGDIGCPLCTLSCEIIADGNEVRATGIWSDTFEDASSGTVNADRTFSWVLVHEGDTWRIRRVPSK